MLLIHEHKEWLVLKLPLVSLASLVVDNDDYDNNGESSKQSMVVDCDAAIMLYHAVRFNPSLSNQ